MAIYKESAFQMKTALGYVELLEAKY